MLAHLGLLAAIAPAPGSRAPAAAIPVLTARLAPAAPPPAEAQDPPAAVTTRHAEAAPSREAPRVQRPEVAEGSRSSETRYYPAHELDVLPRLAGGLPDGPAQWRRDGTGRSLRLDLMIDAGGAVTGVRAAGAVPEAPELAAARMLWAHARFEPARRAGHAVASRIVIEVDW